MLISLRGGFGEEHPWQTEGGMVTEGLLQTLRVPFERLQSPQLVAQRVHEAKTLANAALRPVALLLCRELMWED